MKKRCKQNLILKIMNFTKEESEMINQMLDLILNKETKTCGELKHALQNLSLELDLKEQQILHNSNNRVNKQRWTKELTTIKKRFECILAMDVAKFVDEFFFTQFD